MNCNIIIRREGEIDDIDITTDNFEITEQGVYYSFEGRDYFIKQEKIKSISIYPLI